MDFKNELKDLTLKNMDLLMKVAYEEGYNKAKLDIKHELKESEDSAYVIHNKNTYVNLEYEYSTNKRRLGMDLNNMKRSYFELGALYKEGEKYVPCEDSDIFILINNKLYIKQDELCVLYLVHSKQRLIHKGIYEDIKVNIEKHHDELVGLLYNIVNVENKQRNPIYNDVRDSKKITQGEISGK